MRVEKYNDGYYEQVNDIFENSFPKEERYNSLGKLIEKSNIELYCIVDKEVVLGFTYLIFYENMIFILYLAVKSNNRSKGLGSYLLNWIIKKYENKEIFINIEEVKKDFEDFEVRKKRLNFYLKNGFYLTEYVSKEGKYNFNILSNKKELDIAKYKKLDMVISNILDEPISNIVKQ